MTAGGTAELRSLLTEWLAHDSRPVLIAHTNGLRANDGHGAPQPLTIETVVRGLLADPTPLPTHALKALGLPTGTRTSAVARLLFWAVEEPAGPRCRSYRAASYFLADLDTNDLDGFMPRDNDPTT